MQNIKNQMISFANEILKNFNGAVLGLSGGLDSAIVLRILSECEKKPHCLIMPTNISNKTNLDDAINLANKYALKYEIINIQNILDEFIKASGSNDKVLIGNFAARIRMTLLYDYSAKHNLLVAGTSNKSELMLGYGTIWGDLACAFNILGDFYKSELFEFAKFLELPNNIISKKPSADLYEGQDDESDIGFTYTEIDKFLKNYEKNIIDNNYIKLLDRINKNKFKRENIKIFKRS
ncbi:MULTISPECIES: NAD(+) synthase [unclassified Campylobacter]|uniref:NAD(+) synthase n=1 Tax=unclassified Campylobacter TaxID=2593542 RepID=UPI001BDB0C3E|nr:MULTISPECIES: NAD(+) synthase [unclassified Campylobacter]MBZ7976494.1 NAD(+) synthase [Campylobacter sp. RM12637]MBZ7978077.1 NAD(+) synthase [Campylobacter sp. RM12654]MBZ7979972.1 NAD(+) synthase [Campylobacter sp. RM12642]MBZ7981374.1 NAD(+) synthase [Campylobacter sp. RM12640]MBZ7983776.1 NAD(+) synthase [Campylobacter sp. RM12647]MBZ7989030.1 NAD(+) synthase [Campylobacter sp. RM12635]MBZ7991193.1 NAD(+) synthase [Campylobacter sp. RM9331]MBZ7993697.1 NAD(+) synthase [Campylobacter